MLWHLNIGKISSTNLIFFLIQVRDLQFDSTLYSTILLLNKTHFNFSLVCSVLGFENEFIMDKTLIQLRLMSNSTMPMQLRFAIHF